MGAGLRHFVSETPLSTFTPWPSSPYGPRMEVKVLVAQLSLTLGDPMDCSPPGSSVQGILQPRILEYSVYFSIQYTGSSSPGDF